MQACLGGHQPDRQGRVYVLRCVGGPGCFYGREVFLIIRLMFRLCGMISYHSDTAANQLYADCDWVVKQIGVGGKAAEALDAVFGDYNHKLTLWKNHKASFEHLWSLVVAATQPKPGVKELVGNGDHCQLIGIPCAHEAESLKGNQDTLYALVKNDLQGIIDRYWVRINTYTKSAWDSKKMVRIYRRGEARWGRR